LGVNRQAKVKSDTSAYTIFNNALELEDPAARARYLKDACADDANLYGRVEKLLRAHEEAGGFFSEPLKSTRTALMAATTDLPGMEKAGDVIGRYKLLEQIGEGGCGVVHLAEQQEPVRRRVALKVIKLGMDTKQVVTRFEAERQALALMDHPNIARVLDAGATDTGRPYFVMELVRGIKITEFCDQKKLSTQERLELFISVCRAVQHAHQKGVIHRDLKPSNLLVTVVDGAPVPKVIDFGIAKATSNQPLTDKTPFTAFAQFVGTPAYMSPEQAEMSGVDIDTRTDIYSLGVVLYELLTGKTPFDAEALLHAGIDEIRRTIREVEPLKPSTRLTQELSRIQRPLAPARGEGVRRTGEGEGRIKDLIRALRGDLDWIVMKCLEKERSRRYETVNGLAADILRHLNTEPVVARPPSRWYEFQKTVRRHKFGFAAAAAIASVLLLGIVASTWQAVRATRAEREQSRLREGAEQAKVKQEQLRQQADEARVRAETAEHDARQQLFSALLEQARATVKGGELGQRVRTLDALRRAAAISNTVELRREAFAALALPDLRFERELLSGSEFTLAQLDPRFERMALCRGRGPVEVRSVSDHRLLTSLPASTNLMAYFGRWSGHGRFLAIKRDYDPSGARADVEIWDVPSARRILLLRDVPWGVVSFHPHLPQMIAMSRDGSAAVWNLEDGTRTTQFKVPAAPFDLKYSPDGKRFALRYHSNNIGTVSVHNAADATLLASQTIPRGLHWLDWHPTGRWIAAGADDGSVNLIDSQTGESRTLGQHMAAAPTMAFSPDGRYLITGGWEKELICWDLQAMQRAFTMPLGSYQLQFDADGQQCAVTIVGKSVQLHAFEHPTTHREFAEDLGAPIHHAAFSPDGRWLAASGDKQAGVWDLASGGPAALDDGAYLAHFFFTPEARELFGSRNKKEASDCFRWRLPSAIPQSATGGPPNLERLPLHKPVDFTFLGLSSNAVVMTSSKGSQVLAPDELENGSDRWTRTHLGINGVSPDGRWLAIYLPYTPTLYIYRVPGLERVAKLTHPANINDFAFSPLSDEVAIWSSRGGVEFWNTATWERTRALTNFTGILYTPDARSLWLRQDWRTAGLYDARTLEPWLLLPAGMLPLALSPDGRHIAVSVNAQRLQVWDLDKVRARFRELGLDWESNQAPAVSARR
jgi:serine/threonine protein kinase/WD40 repeat protein